MLIDFLYRPGEYVKVSFLGLNYKGRILYCMLHSGGEQQFRVQYASDQGELKTDSFYADEIQVSS